MPSTDGVRNHTRGAVFSMDQLIIAGAFMPLVDSSGSVKYIRWLPSNDPAHNTCEGRQHRCWSKANRSTRPSRTRRPQPSTQRPPSGTSRNTTTLPTNSESPSRHPTNLKLVSSSSWTPQADKPTHGQAQAGPPGHATRRDRHTRRHNQGWQGEGRELL